MVLVEECVWDYPRPAICEAITDSLKVTINGSVVAESNSCFRTLETSHPPTYYFPRNAVRMGQLVPSGKASFCEWTGAASYYNFISDRIKILNVCWCYNQPASSFFDITGYLSFYASKTDECLVNGKRVEQQDGGFYGGWITSNLIGPFKGGAGTLGW